MSSHSIVMIGATGAVGGETVKALMTMPEVTRLTLLGRRPLAGITSAIVTQQSVDVFDPKSFAHYLPGHDTAICTFGVGQPSKVSHAELAKTDKDAVLAFAHACKSAGVRHFQLLGAVGADAHSRSFYLRTKGELEEGLKAVAFERLSVFRPSMIVTPNNRYGLSQAALLVIWPWLTPLLAGPARKFRGIRVEQLGQAIAHNIRSGTHGTEILEWDAIVAAAKT